MRYFTLLAGLLLLCFVMPLKAAKPPVVFTSPLFDWEVVDDAGFGAEALHGGHLRSGSGSAVRHARDGIRRRGGGPCQDCRHEVQDEWGSRTCRRARGGTSAPTC